MENNKEVSTTEIVEEVKTDAVVKEEPQKEEPKKEKLYTRAEVENIKKGRKGHYLKRTRDKKNRSRETSKDGCRRKSKL